MRIRTNHLGAVAVAATLLGLTACAKGPDSGPTPNPTGAASDAASAPVAGGTGAVSEPGTTGGGAASGKITSVPGLDPSALAVMNQPAYDYGRWSMSVHDIDTGETLIALDEHKLVEPGSVVKTYSMGAGWLYFGPDHTVITPVKRQGEVVAGVLQGDLILVGKGDLTMGGRTRPDGTVDFTNLDHNDANLLPGATLTPEDPLTGLDQLAAQVKQSGINAVTGDVVVDDRLFNELLEDQPISPIIVNNNLIDFTTTATRPGETADSVMRPIVAPWAVTSEVKTVAAGGRTAIGVSSPEHGKVVLSGTIAADSPPVVNVYAFDDPGTYARTAFIEALGRAGVSVDADPIAANSTASLATPAEVEALPSVAQLESLPLEQEAKYTLKVSYNRGAETMICLLAAEVGSEDCDDGLAKADEIWTKAGLNTDAASFIDGSGLINNLITPASEVELMTIMAKRPDGERWKATLPILGVDGSLAMVQADSPSRGKVMAKTGSLGSGDFFNNRIRLPSKALGGYIDTEKGRHLAFSIVVNNALFPDVLGVFAANEDVGKVASIIQQSY